MRYNKKIKIGFKFQVSSFRILFFLFLFSIFYFLFSASVVSAAVLYLTPSSGSYNLDDVFLVEVRLDTQGEIINVVEVDLDFSFDILEVKDFSTGDSVLALWMEEPGFSNEQGLVSFSGGAPGGYWGANGLLGRVVFQARGTTQNNTWNNAEIKFLGSSRVLLNDGFGTEAGLTRKGASFSILTGEGDEKDEWQREIEKDKKLPEPFKVEISQDEAIFEGKYFITFSTTDKQTGVDYYEVKEGRDSWKIATSPYVLENQKLTSEIRVRAVDKAGNYWMEIVEAPKTPAWKWAVYIVLAAGLITVIIWVIRRRRKRKVISSRAVE